MAGLAVVSPVAFFITLRETLEAGIIIVVLLGFIKQIVPPSSPIELNGRLSGSREELVHSHPSSTSAAPAYQTFRDEDDDIATRDDQANGDGERIEGAPVVVPALGEDEDEDSPEEEQEVLETAHMGKGERDSLVRRMKVQIWTGAISGLAIAMVIGASFLVILFTFARDIWVEAENLWEGTFCGIASILIMIMGLAFLRLPYAQTKWRLKLLSAYRSSANDDSLDTSHPHAHRRQSHSHRFRLFRSQQTRSRFILFGLPFITVLREGLEGVVFLGGISLSQTPSSVFLGAALGLVVGALAAYALFSSTSPLSMKRFTTISTLLLFLIGAGLASRSAYSLERQYFINGVGTAAAESGNGPGSYRVKGNLWKLTWGDPEIGNEGTTGWYQLANSLVGWNNVGTYWTVSIYNAYWLIIIATLVRMKYAEGRTKILGRHSRRGREREKARRRAAGDDGDNVGTEEEAGLLGQEREEE